jgi:hypothetical protein
MKFGSAEGTADRSDFSFFDWQGKIWKEKESCGN